MATDDQSGESGLRRLLKRFTATDQELELEELRRDSAKPGCVCADTAGRGDIVTVAGRLRMVVYTPRTNLPTLEAELDDGTDVITLVFLGRRQIAGIEPGRPLRAHGRIAVRDGRKVIYNPHYELDASH